MFDAAPVRGTWRMLASPNDVLDLMDGSAEGVVACVQDAGATFLVYTAKSLVAPSCYTVEAGKRLVLMDDRGR